MSAYISARSVFTPMLGLAILGAALTGAGCDDRPQVGEVTSASLNCDDAGLHEIVAHPDLYEMKTTDTLYAGYILPPGPDMVVDHDGILANDVLFCANEIEVTVHEAPIYGALDLHPDGTFIYYPQPGLSTATCGDRFSYHVYAESAPNEVSISSVVIVDILFPASVELPCSRLEDDTYAMARSETLFAGDVPPPPPPGDDAKIDSHGILDNDYLVEVGPVDIVIDSAPVSGTLVTLLGNGGFIYEPPADINLRRCGDRFHYHLEASNLASPAAVVRIFFEDCPGIRFYWRGYDHQPYIYKGCPDPGPEPWRSIPVIRVDSSRQIADVDLSSDVPLDVSVRSAPRNGNIIPNAYGFVFVPIVDGPSQDRVGLRIAHGACVYEAEAEVVVDH